MRALLVDDERSFADALAERLQLRGFDVHVAYDAESALGLLAGGAFDAAILDVGLPGMNGLDLLQQLKRLYPLTEVLMLTGHADVQSAVEGMKRGAANWLLKPADIEDLTAELHQAHTRRRLREEEQRMAETAKLASLGRLAEGVAHEINNPVGIMHNAAGWIEDLLDDPAIAHTQQAPELRRTLDTIRRQGHRVREITRKLLFFGKGLDPRPQPVDVAALMEQALSLLSDRIDRLGVTVHKHLPAATPGEGNLPTLLAPPVELRQACIHLLENALDAMENPAPQTNPASAAPPVATPAPTRTPTLTLTLTLTLAFRPAAARPEATASATDPSATPAASPSSGTPDISGTSTPAASTLPAAPATSAASGNHFILTVADTGHGITPDDLPHIFDPFFSTREVGKGMGLGLAVTHGVVRRLGGTIDVHSTPAGTTFTLTLPATPPAAPTA